MRVNAFGALFRSRLLRCALLLIVALAPMDARAASAADANRFTTDDAIARTAGWSLFDLGRPPLNDSSFCPATPHPAVARIIAPENGATAYGSGTLVDVRDQYGLVVTNWHVVCDASGVVEVVFPDGFRSHARPLKVDRDWDLAALVIWRPSVEPVRLASQPPRPGDLLTIHGYGQGKYRIATGRCTQYYAPHANFPTEMVELDVEARQGDSGGPIFNQRGELAGVLFGAGQGTTLGSFGPRVSTFLATLAPDIGQAREQSEVAVADRPAPNVRPKPNDDRFASRATWPSSPWTPTGRARHPSTGSGGLVTSAASNEAALKWGDITGNGWYEPLKSLLAVVGLAAIALRLVKAVR
jgi:hypothetical protein